MDTISNAISFLKNAVIFVITEMKQLERMNQFISTNILTYEVAISNLLESIKRLNSPLYSDIVNPSTLASILSLVNSHVLSLQKLVVQMTKWNNHIKAGGFKKFRALIKERPSVLAETLFSKLLEIKPLLFEIANIERDTLGSGVRIHNPLLRACWVLSGKNQVNDSSIHKNIITENMYILLKRELGGDIKKPQVWKNAILKFVDCLDGCAAGIPDDQISISEMNEFIIPPEKDTFRRLLKDYIEPNERSLRLSITDIPSFIEEKDENKEELENKPENQNEEENQHQEPDNENKEEIDDNIPSSDIEEEIIEMNVDINTKKIDSRHPVEIPKCENYGSNWCSILLGQFVIPENNHKHLEFDFVEIITKATDQGWGGTGHDNVRYQINDNPIEVGFFIDRNKCPDNIYKFTINYEKLKIGDNVKLWLSCAPWNGWTAQAHSMNLKIMYD
jgi:hypothetical protein